MKLFVTGAGGQLGRELIARTAPGHLEIAGATRQQLDITSAGQIETVLASYDPQVIINAAAYTRVDAAETDRRRAEAVNATAAGLLADWCHRSKRILIHVSTDFVFNGRQRTPYRESDPIDPLNVYGATKARGEALVRKRLQRHLIVRTSWLYSAHGQNFVKTIIGLTKDKEVLRIVADQFGSPTSAADLAEAILTMVEQLHPNASPLWGTYHYCNSGVVSWHAFAAEITRQVAERSGRRQVRTKAITTADYPTAAQRPAYSALDCRRFEAAFGRRPSDWDLALKPVVRQLIAAAH